jgi:heme-degrading monooxygenase HmoA
MSVVRIFAITGEEHLGESIEHLFAHRALAYQSHAGFEGFELLAPTDGRGRWLAVTRWADEASFDEFIGAAESGDQWLAGRISTLGAPESLHGEVWSFRIGDDGTA